jgi:hypothetical protein
MNSIISRWPRRPRQTQSAPIWGDWPRRTILHPPGLPGAGLSHRQAHPSRRAIRHPADRCARRSPPRRQRQQLRRDCFGGLGMGMAAIPAEQAVALRPVQPHREGRPPVSPASTTRKDKTRNPRPRRPRLPGQGSTCAIRAIVLTGQRARPGRSARTHSIRKPSSAGPPIRWHTRLQNRLRSVT